ncbi:ABC transporter permease [Rothia halotolerans]|uniref:ABC transporter permease n=1 Tax=Rothia halotolerans TaxID=405770 RepID=UPI00101C4040|nr:ABC transporter permease [Rothia halotolerans]
MRDALRELIRSPRQHAATLLVVVVAAMFGTLLIGGTVILSNVVLGNEAFSGSGTVIVMLALVAIVFFGIALFVASLTVSNTFSIVVAGRTGRLALLRLIGASARRLRRSIASEGLLVGLLGAVLGTAAGAALCLAGAAWAESAGAGEDLSAGVVTGWLAWPGLLTALTAWWAAHVGARPVLTVSPLEATRRSAEPALKAVRSRRGMLVLSVAATVLGAVLLVAGTLLGSLNPVGVLPAFLGGVLSFTGLALGAGWVMPAVFRATSLLLGRGTAGRLAAAGIRRHPLRSARTSMGLVIGVTLVVMFATAGETFRTVMQEMLDAAGADASAAVEFNRGVDSVLLFLYAMLLFSVVIAAIGVANSMKATIMQRARELALLRVTGLSRGQLWRMIGSEAAHLTVAAALLAIPLGVFYGWCGVLSMLWSVQGIGFFPPAVPWATLAVVVAGCVLITLAATVLPARRAAAAPPVRALAVA